jgi:hypothetical protein
VGGRWVVGGDWGSVVGGRWWVVDDGWLVAAVSEGIRGYATIKEVPDTVIGSGNVHTYIHRDGEGM